MDASIWKQVLTEPAKYIDKAAQLLLDTEEQFQLVARMCAKVTPQYCYKESQLENARAIHRAVIAITNSQRVMFSDEMTLKHWLVNFKET